MTNQTDTQLPNKKRLNNNNNKKAEFNGLNYTLCIMAQDRCLMYSSRI